MTLRRKRLDTHRIYPVPVYFFEHLVYLNRHGFPVNSVGMNTSGDRLRTLLRECHLSASDFAANRRVTPQHVNNWFKRGIPMARMEEIAELLCVNSRWLRTGYGVKHPRTPIISETPLQYGPVPCEPAALNLQPITVQHTGMTDVDVPFYNEVLDPCGPGKTRVQEIPDCRVRLNYPILRAMDVSPAQAICAPMIGNSMAHRIQSGSTVAIDRSLTQIVDGEIYALEQDGMLRIKYVYRLPNNGLRLRCHNHEEYPDELFSAAQIEEQSIFILGWVFWWSTLNTPRPTTAYPLETEARTAQQTAQAPVFAGKPEKIPV